MSTPRVDLRDLTTRLGRLAEVQRAAERLLERVAFQPPIDDERMPAPAYWLLPHDGLEDLHEALHVALADSEERPRLRVVSLEERRPSPTAGDGLELELPIVPNRANATNRAIRGNWQSAASPLKAEKQRVLLALSEWTTEAPRFTVPVACEIVIAWGRTLHIGKARARVEQDRPLDPDGAAGALKPWLDALTEARIWADDRLAAPDFRIIQRSADDGNEHTIIRIRPLELTEANAAARNPQIQRNGVRRVR